MVDEDEDGPTSRMRRAQASTAALRIAEPERSMAGGTGSDWCPMSVAETGGYGAESVEAAFIQGASSKVMPSAAAARPLR